MATRGKGLFFDTMIEFLHTIIKNLSQGFRFCGYGMPSTIYCFGVFQDVQSLFFLNSKIGNKFMTKINEIIPVKDPLITCPSIRKFFSFGYFSFKEITEFFKDCLVCINDCKSIDVKSIFSSVVWCRTQYRDRETALSVYKTSRISEKSFSHDTQRNISRNKWLAATSKRKGVSKVLEIMRCSELMGNHERIAEMTIPLYYHNYNNCELKLIKSNSLTYVIITREVTAINQDPVLNETVARLGQSLRETEDQLYRDMLLATASVINCVNGTNGDVPTEMARADIDAVVATLQNNNGEFISEMIEGANKFGTGPVRDAYAAMANSNLIGQLENVQGFINKANYPNQNGTQMLSEWGTIGNIRYFLSSRGSVSVGSSLLGNDIYNVFITAQEAYTGIELTGETAKFIYHPPGWGDDPVELRQTAGWRAAMVPRITNDAWIINQRCTLA